MTAGLRWGAAALGRLAELVTQRTGLALSGDRWLDLAALIPRPPGPGEEVDATDALLAWLTTDHAAFELLVSELTVKETYFFRDPGQFAFVARELCPGWRARGGEPARLWSAGCATGEEAYSLAMLCAREQTAARVVGTDISAGALATARGARFRPWSVRLPDSAPALPFLRADGGGFAVDERVREQVRFRRLNLASADEQANGLAGLDLVLCRNVLIYLERAIVPSIVARLYESLAEGGWLLTAASDPPLGAMAPFDVLATDEGVFYRRPPARAARQPVEAKAVMVRRRPVAPRARRADARRPSAPRTDAPAPETATEHYAHALRLAEAGKPGEALESVRRALYLDRSLAMVHFTRGTLMRGLGDAAEARQSFRKARVRCQELPADAPLPLGDGVTAGYLTELCDRHLMLLSTETRRA